MKNKPALFPVLLFVGSLLAAESPENLARKAQSHFDGVKIAEVQPLDPDCKDPECWDYHYEPYRDRYPDEETELNKATKAQDDLDALRISLHDLQKRSQERAAQVVSRQYQTEKEVKALKTEAYKRVVSGGVLAIALFSVAAVTAAGSWLAILFSFLGFLLPVALAASGIVKLIQAQRKQEEFSRYAAVKAQEIDNDINYLDQQQPAPGEGELP